MPLGLQCLDDAHLVLGRDAREHGALLDQRGDFVLTQAIEFAPLVRLAGEAEFARDGRSGDAMIAGNHLDLDAGSS